jgi:hypothetical protein
MDNTQSNPGQAAAPNNDETTTITIDVKQLNAVVRAVVLEIVAGAVTDIRKGQGSLVDRIDELSNTIMGMKNSLIATNQALNTTNQALTDLKKTGGKRAVVYVRDKDEPADLFGN